MLQPIEGSGRGGGREEVENGVTSPASNPFTQHNDQIQTEWKSKIQPDVIFFFT